VLEQPGEDAGVLLPHRLQRVGIEPEQLEDGRRHLRRRDLLVDAPALEVVAGDEERDVGVVERAAPVLGDLALALGVDDAGVGLDEAR
jgi:hypothetical protein